jgi:hypothetical protein
MDDWVMCQCACHVSLIVPSEGATSDVIDKVTCMVFLM